MRIMKSIKNLHLGALYIKIIQIICKHTHTHIYIYMYVEVGFGSRLGVLFQTKIKSKNHDSH